MNALTRMGLKRDFICAMFICSFLNTGFCTLISSFLSLLLLGKHKVMFCIIYFLSAEKKDIFVIMYLVAK